MTSKEAIETLFDLLCEREHTNSEHSFWLKLYQEVREDLEAFEIIWNHRLDVWEIECLFDRYPDVDDAMTYLNARLNTYDQLCREEVEELKKWIKKKELDNDK